MNRLFLALLCTLAACAGHKPETQPPRQVTEGWTLLPGCKIQGHTTGFTLQTDGHLENDTLAFRLIFAQPQAAFPHIEITGTPIRIAPEGRGTTYGFILPFDINTTAQMLQEDSQILITYTPQNNTHIWQANLSVSGLAQALVSLNRQCP